MLALLFAAGRYQSPLPLAWVPRSLSLRPEQTRIPGSRALEARPSHGIYTENYSLAWIRLTAR